MIYMVTVGVAYSKLASSAKKALALAYCEMGRKEEVLDKKIFLQTVRDIKKKLKTDGIYVVDPTDSGDLQAPAGKLPVIVQVVNMKSAEELLASKFGIIYEKGE